MTDFVCLEKLVFTSFYICLDEDLANLKYFFCSHLEPLPSHPLSGADKINFVFLPELIFLRTYVYERLNSFFHIDRKVLSLWL